MSKIEITTSELKLNGPKVDKSWTLNINVPEYEKQKLAPILLLDEGNFKVTIEDE